MINLIRFLPRIFGALKSLGPTAKAVLGAATLFAGFFTYFNDLWSDLFTKIDALVVPAGAAADFSPLSMANYYFPLDTVCTYIASYLTFIAACTVIRVIKSFIPTVA